MTATKCKSRKCEECGAIYPVFASALLHVNKRGNVCSKECRASRRMKTHGKDCKQCGKRYVPQTAQEYCSQGCKTSSRIKHATVPCKNCGEGFDGSEGGVYCSKKCHAKFMRDEKSCVCLFCCTVFYRYSLSRKVSKHASSKYHNRFCSRRCAKQLVSRESNLNARCSCGKLIGRVGAKCEDCTCAPRWAELGEWANGIRGAFDAPQTEWSRRCCSAVTSLNRRHRDRVGTQPKLKARSTWEESIKSSMMLMLLRTKNRLMTGWKLRASNAANLLGKRARRVQRNSCKC